MMIKMNHKNGHETLKCRYCCEADETQEHIIQECTKSTKDENNIRYAEVFKENNIETNRAIARAPIEINQKINENQWNQSQKHWLPMRWATWYNKANAMYVCMYVCKGGFARLIGYNCHENSMNGRTTHVYKPQLPLNTASWFQFQTFHSGLTNHENLNRWSSITKHNARFYYIHNSRWISI